MITANAANGYLPLFTLPSIIHPLFAPLPTPPKKMDQSVGLKEMFRRWMRWSLNKIAGSPVQQVISLPKYVTRPWRSRVWFNWARAAIAHGFSTPRTTFECIYTNTFTSKESCGLDNHSPKPLGQNSTGKSKFHFVKCWIINSTMWEYFSSFHFNGHIIGFCPQTQKLEPPCTG